MRPGTMTTPPRATSSSVRTFVPSGLCASPDTALAVADVWAPEMATTYGQVFWTDQGNVPIPPAIVKRFAGKVMAITGFEQDQVIPTPSRALLTFALLLQVMVQPVGQPGVNPDQDVSVPINWACECAARGPRVLSNLTPPPHPPRSFSDNHHFMAWMTGKGSEMKEVQITDKDELWANHGKATKMEAFEKPGVAREFADVAPSSQMFSEGNGGESRKSFHGYPAGFAQLIESPETWHITPMQVGILLLECVLTYLPTYLTRDLAHHADADRHAQPRLRRHAAVRLQLHHLYARRRAAAGALRPGLGRRGREAARRLHQLLRRAGVPVYFGLRRRPAFLPGCQDQGHHQRLRGPPRGLMRLIAVHRVGRRVLRAGTCLPARTHSFFY
jgi:hypothetical protein